MFGSRNFPRRTLRVQRDTLLRSATAAAQGQYPWVGHHIVLEVDHFLKLLVFMFSKLPKRLGIALKNQMCTTGAAKFDMPHSFTTTRDCASLSRHSDRRSCPCTSCRGIYRRHIPSPSQARKFVRRTNHPFPDGKFDS